MPYLLDPLAATQKLNDDYVRYLRTIYFFSDEELRRQLWSALDQPQFLLRGPILEASPPFRRGKSIAQLVADGVLDPDFQTLCSEALPLNRPLHLHQQVAIEKVVQRRRNVVVATGTGSGKTETFLLPIFNHLLQQRAAGLLQQPGVRALLLYPMNALANDQLKRLRQLLAQFPDITFGRYTGETPERQIDAERLFREQFRAMPLDNERLSRERLRADPPHLFITNYAMLEYLLLRPRDNEFFDGETAHHWRFIVLDEAHIYDGANGIELGMLLRRLKDRVLQSEPGRLTCIATSATLGKGPADFPAVVRFGSELFGEPFEWSECDPDHQDVVEGLREHAAELATPWGHGAAALYHDLASAIVANELPAALASLARQHNVPEAVVVAAEQAAAALDRLPDQTNAFLFGLLAGDEHLHRLRTELDQPQPLTTLAPKLSIPAAQPQHLIDLVNLAVRARRLPATTSLLPARYHVFARALEGAFLCLNATHPVHQVDHAPRLFLNRYEQCPHCHGQVFELATCPRCGTAYIVGRELPVEGKTCKVLRHPSSVNDELGAGLSYFVLASHVQAPDEDEAVLTGQSLDQLGIEQLEAIRLCLGCGALAESAKRPACDCPPGTPQTVFQRVRSVEDPLRRCVACGVRNPNGVVYRFLASRDAPVSVLATSLYQLLPPDEDSQVAHIPGQGRKLMVFADSRQDAAFFAPYLERTYQQILRRRLILNSLTQDEAGRAGHLRLQDAATRIHLAAEQYSLFSVEQSYDERERLSLQWLMQEFVALDLRIGLEGLGLLQLRPVAPPNWQPPAPLLTPPWNLTTEEAWALIVLLLNSIRQQGAVTFPDHVDPTGPDFAPRNVRLYFSDYADDQNRVLGWLPRRGSNRRIAYLARVLRTRQSHLSTTAAEQHALDLLKGLWRYLSAPDSEWRSHLTREYLPTGAVAFQLNHKLWEWVPTQVGGVPVYYCERCFNITYTNIAQVCPQYGCDGQLRMANEKSLVWLNNHYRHLYQLFNPIELSAEEHTAQWTSKAASDIQSRFIDGYVNVLSCSTTFELGVDVGDLQTVLMRNVPPTTANYVQRAGRAGRRTDSVAFVLTFAQRRSHDLTFFGQPERMVAGRVDPPVVVIENEKIVRRHLHSVFLSAFFRWAQDVHQRLFSTVGDFFEAQPGQVSGPELLRTFVASYPEPLRDALLRIIPSPLQNELGVQEWSWLPHLLHEQNTGILDRAVQEISQDLETYQRLELEASNQRRYKQADHYSRVATTVRKRELLGFLGARSVLPKYGFPVDVVELRTEHVPIREAQSVELQRDLRVAISEYAPGSEVVAAKKIWVGDGLYVLPGRDWPKFHYAVCPGCGRFHRSLEALAPTCTVCGANVFGYPRRYGEYVIPLFGFVAHRETHEPGERRPRRTYASQVYFSEYAPVLPEDAATLEPVSSLSGQALALSWRYSRFGKLAVVNSGHYNAGFRICSSCGWAEPMTPAVPGTRSQRQQNHKNPRTGQPCSSRSVSTLHLGHEFITDVLELQFRGYAAPLNNNELWLSTLYAILEGASDALSIARDDLNGTLYPGTLNAPPALVLFDNVPGGAGHVRRLHDEPALHAVLRAALERVSHNECGDETSCYGCLRNFYNQYFHDQLRRGLARDFLAQVLMESNA